MKKTSQRVIVTGALVLSFILLFLINNMRIAYAQNENETINLSQNFVLEEFSENFGVQENVTSVEIDLGSSRWNVTDIELNFTEIKLEREIKPIEDKEQGLSDLLDYSHPVFFSKGYGVEIFLPVPILLYGVYIYGYKHSSATEEVYIQIRDYDSVNNKPGSFVHHNQTLNISLLPGWYHQNFSSSVSLSSGKYFLVLINPSYTQSYSHYWAYTNTPNNSSLHTSDYKTSWSNGVQGEPNLYKLVQKVDRTYKPKDIEMSIEVDGKSYNVSNGVVSGSGNVSIQNLNFSPNDDTLKIPINENETNLIELNFTLSYRIKLENPLFANGNVTIGEHLANNEWVVDPQLIRTNGNYSVEYETPYNWKDRRVLRDVGSGWVDVTGAITITDNLVFIPNNTIIAGSNWRITANSTKVGFALDVPLKSFNAGENLQFSLTTPCLEGNYTFILYNSLGFEETNNKTICDQPLNPPEFSYTLPSDSVSGVWNGFIYWNNESDAGVQSQNFTISGSSIIISGGGGGGGGGGSTTVVTGLDPLIVLTISIIIVAAIAGSLTSYQTIKRLKRKRDLQMQKLRNKVIDSLNLNYIMISENASGLNVYEQFFGGKEIDPTLISGFLAAIRSFGIEITGTFQQSQTIKLEFQNSKILMNEFRNFRLILLMGENPSDDFIEYINNLSMDIEKEYGELIRDFDGKLDGFKGIGKLIERHLNVSFLFPLKVISSEATKLTLAERLVLNKAKQIMKQNNLDYIFTSFLMDDQTYEPKRIKAIFGLIEKEIFKPIRLKDQNIKH